MADLNQLYLDISMDAADIDKIALDDAVDVSFDALPGQIFTGRITQLQPGLTTSGSFPTVRGLVVLDASATGAFQNLRLGMSATVDVISGKASGVLIIPVEALHEQAPGQYIVFVVQAGQTAARPVTVGLRDFASVEIKTGLKLGEVVSTAIQGNLGTATGTPAANQTGQGTQ
jgi:HlyD family secretion protein